MGVIFEAHFGLLTAAELPAEISEIGDDWAGTLASKRQKVHTNLRRVIADEDDYLTKIVDRSNAGYEEFIGTDHPDYNEIMLKRAVKMPGSATDWINNVDSAFAEGGDFEANVTANKQKFLNKAKVILRVVGDSDKIYGPVQKLSIALDGKKSILDAMVDSNKDHVITEDTLKRFFVDKGFKTSVVKFVNQALSYVVYALDSGKYDDAWIETNIAAKYNNLLAAMVNANTVNSELDPANCSITIEKDATTGRWGVKLVEATPDTA